MSHVAHRIKTNTFVYIITYKQDKANIEALTEKMSNC